MINTKTIKSRIAAMDKRVGELPPLIIVDQIERATGKTRRIFASPLDLIVAIVQEMRTDAGTAKQPGQYSTIRIDFSEDPDMDLRENVEEAFAILQEERKSALC